MKKIILFLLSILAQLASTQNNTNTTTVICPFGSFPTSRNRCVECHIDCPNCEGFDKICTSCPKGQKLNEIKNICQSCNKGQLTCHQNLIECQSHYELIQGKCTPRCLVKNCAKCVKNEVETCDNCKNGYKITTDGSLCVKQQTSIENQSQLQNQPILCRKGEYLFNNTCLKCHSHCQTCVENHNQCLQCKDKRIKLGWKCISKTYVEFNITLSLEEEDLDNILFDGIDEFKWSLVKYFLPFSYENQNISVISLKYASLNKDKKIVIFYGIVDSIQKSNPIETNRFLFSKLRARNNVGIYTLLSSNTRVIGQVVVVQETNLTNSTIGENENNERQKKQQNQKRTTSIILGASLGGIVFIMIVSLIICYFCKCGIFKTKESNNFGKQTSRRLKT